MKRTEFAAVAVVLAVAIGGATWPAAAGDLQPPPGPITPTMKTLTDVAPRTAVHTLSGTDTCLHRIDQPGSYYLTAALAGEAGKTGIEIASGEVTLDLMGFGLVGVAGSRDGIIVQPGHRNVTIINGTVRDWGLAGVYAINTSNSELRDLHTYRNRLEGLAVGIGSVVTRCTAEENGMDGIVTDIACTLSFCTAWHNGRGAIGGDGIDVGDGSTVTACSAFDNADAGIFVDLGCSVMNCASRDNGGDGVHVGAHGVVSHCSASFNDGDGFHLAEGVTITGCSASLNSGDGIEVSSFCRVLQNGCEINGMLSHTGAGIRVTGLDNRIEDNHLVLNEYGIKVDDVSNLIIRNSALHNGCGTEDDYVIVPGNRVGTITSDPTTAGAWANFQ